MVARMRLRYCLLLLVNELMTFSKLAGFQSARVANVQSTDAVSTKKAEKKRKRRKRLFCATLLSMMLYHYLPA